ncbi:MAG: type II secretion system GspH family protein [Elusimicrobiota bacterium]|jgi:prepilin-type N-terminal cleavage/methylation domain-containing protein|nr:type II secretion system GspH family protein [Elusimicrobiota bacterium]
MIKNIKGFTLIESLISMLLIAIMVAAIFSAVMAARRALIQPSQREEMALAIESASDLLKYYMNTDSAQAPSSDIVQAFCNISNGTVALSTGVTHDIACLLPLVCDPNLSTFTYTISETTVPINETETTGMLAVQFNINCNGETL